MSNLSTLCSMSGISHWSFFDKKNTQFVSHIYVSVRTKKRSHTFKFSHYSNTNVTKTSPAFPSLDIFHTVYETCGVGVGVGVYSECTLPSAIPHHLLHHTHCITRTQVMTHTHWVKNVHLTSPTSHHRVL